MYCPNFHARLFSQQKFSIVVIKTKNQKKKQCYNLIQKIEKVIKMEFHKHFHTFQPPLSLCLIKMNGGKSGMHVYLVCAVHGS